MKGALVVTTRKIKIKNPIFIDGNFEVYIVVLVNDRKNNIQSAASKRMRITKRPFVETITERFEFFNVSLTDNIEFYIKVKPKYSFFPLVLGSTNTSALEVSDKNLTGAYTKYFFTDDRSHLQVAIAWIQQ